jgi:hypothetical protein
MSMAQSDSDSSTNAADPELAYTRVLNASRQKVFRHIATFMNLFRRTTLSNLVCFAVFVAVGFAVASTTARSDRAATYPPCYSVQHTDEKANPGSPSRLPWPLIRYKER